MDAVTFSLGLIFPIANLLRAMVVGLNVWAVGCRGKNLISFPGSINAYGGSILLLFIQIIYLFTLLIWLDGQTWSLCTFWRKYITRRPGDDRFVVNSEEGMEMTPVGVEPAKNGLLHISHVHKAFGGKVAVDDASLGLDKGEILGAYDVGPGTIL